MQVKILQNALEHSAILSTFIKLTFAIKTFVLSIFEYPLKTGFTVFKFICEGIPLGIRSEIMCNRFTDASPA